MYKPTAEDKARERRYQLESDMRTLHEAHAIRKDKKRHAAVKAHAKAQLAAISGGGTGSAAGKK